MVCKEQPSTNIGQVMLSLHRTGLVCKKTISIVMERTAHVICVPLYFFRALTLVLEYASAEKLHIEFHPTMLYINCM